MQTGLHFEAFYVSWISLRDKYYPQKGGQDLCQKADSAVNNFVQVHYAHGEIDIATFEEMREEQEVR